MIKCLRCERSTPVVSRRVQGDSSLFKVAFSTAAEENIPTRRPPLASLCECACDNAKDLWKCIRPIHKEGAEKIESWLPRHEPRHLFTRLYNAFTVAVAWSLQGIFSFPFWNSTAEGLRDKCSWLRKKDGAHGDCNVTKVDSAWTQSCQLELQWTWWRWCFSWAENKNGKWLNSC